MTRAMKTLLPLLLGASALTACASLQPAPANPSRLADLSGEALLATQAGELTDAAPEAVWWQLYESAAINQLVSDALASNPSLAEARASLEQARAGLGEARSALLPQTSVSGSGGYVRRPSTTGGDPVESDAYSAGLDVSYELDFFGRVRGSVGAARESVLEAEAARDAAHILVIANTVRAWTDYCASAALLDVASQNVEIARQSYQLTERLYEAGRGLRLDVVQAQSALETASAELPSLQAAQASAFFRLGTLTGRTPVEMRSAIPACDGIPVLTRPIAAGDAGSLIARRPDVRQAEHALAGAAARVDIATAGLYPSVVLGGSVSSSALDIGDLGDSDGLTLSLGPVLSWSFPNLSASRARLAAAEAGADAALARFDRTVLTALQETETALAAFVSERERLHSLEVARNAAQEAAELARVRYRAGADSFVVVLDAERTLANAETALVRSQAAVASAQVDIFLALGGGWPGNEVG
ncbi:efflux transporter outer membrane subunit [Maricaulis parjimensis]|uniref:efflux transporter outer membrane subunit n=1 Tax=Maricaulis parjimensis TaxID=144023 RepID=UPI001EEF75E1|nr:TolC family protein [Maricaulis parjimensis]